MTQIETGKRPFRRGFTLTELLIVIAIIGVLAGLITAAAVNALRAGKRARILLEMKNIGAALENFKNDFDNYPPNLVNLGGTDPTLQRTSSDMQRIAKKAFPQIHPQEMNVFLALAGQDMSSANVTSPQLMNGMTPAEALVFWLGGFSADDQFPLSGPSGPSFADYDDPGDEILEDRDPRYEFDISQYGPRNDDGGFDESTERFVTYTIDLNGDNSIDDGETRQINLWQYFPEGTEKPLLYFDVSRYKPYQYIPVYVDDPNGDPRWVYPLVQFRSGGESNDPQDLAYSNLQKFQLIHAGLDNAWGSTYGGNESNPPLFVENVEDWLLFPDGPFIGDTADTLTNFTDGNLEDEAEE